MVFKFFIISWNSKQVATTCPEMEFLNGIFSQGFWA